MVNRFSWSAGQTTKKKDKREQNNIVHVFVKTSAEGRRRFHKNTVYARFGFSGCLWLMVFRCFGVFWVFRAYGVWVFRAHGVWVFRAYGVQVFRDDILEGQKDDQGMGPKLAKIQNGCRTGHL